MTNREEDDLLWRYLGGYPPTEKFSRRLSNDPCLAKRLAELSLIECTIREKAAKKEGRRILRRGFWLPVGSVGGTAMLLLLSAAIWWLAMATPAGTPVVSGESESHQDLIVAVREERPVKVQKESFPMGYAGEETELVFSSGSEMRFLESKTGGKSGEA